MRPYPLSALLCLSATAQAVNILGLPRRTCFRDNYVVSCRDIPPSTCCVFPTFDLIAQAAYFSVLHSCTVGVWYNEEPTTGELKHCDVARDAVAGPQSDVCMTAGSFAPGGGATWLDLMLCRAAAASEVNATKAEALGPIRLATEARPCIAERYATLYGYPDEGGVYVLEPTAEQFAVLEAMGPTETNKAHVEMLKSVGATYYADAAEAPHLQQGMARM